jgi:hypothetical protein
MSIDVELGPRYLSYPLYKAGLVLIGLGFLFGITIVGLLGYYGPSCTSGNTFSCYSLIHYSSSDPLPILVYGAIASFIVGFALVLAFGPHFRKENE